VRLWGEWGRGQGTRDESVMNNKDVHGRGRERGGRGRQRTPDGGRSWVQLIWRASAFVESLLGSRDVVGAGQG
jgi:hypothetical protein